MWTHPELLYLQSEPYTRLYVEIDHVEGTEFPKYLLDEVKSFLARNCLKPDGIEVVVDPAIPVSQCEGLSLNAVSILSTDGPPDDGRPQPAYFHLFVYDGRKMFRSEDMYPHLTYCGASTIVWNVGYERLRSAAWEIHAIRHEVGHMLGLCYNESHSNGGGHCRKYGCLMNRMPDYLSQLGGLTRLYFREPRLCDDCERDLALARETPSDGGSSFVGPFLIRNADGYSVAALPAYELIVPDVNGFDWRKFLAGAKADVMGDVRNKQSVRRSQRGDSARLWCASAIRQEGKTEAERLEQAIAILNKAAKDPSPLVRSMAPRLLKQKQEALLALTP
jgi:hypothetical protein